MTERNTSWPTRTRMRRQARVSSAVAACASAWSQRWYRRRRGGVSRASHNRVGGTRVGAGTCGVSTVRRKVACAAPLRHRRTSHGAHQELAVYCRQQ
jgi:hypothetical protein